MTVGERTSQDPHDRIEALEQKLETEKGLTDGERAEFDALTRNWSIYPGQAPRNQREEREEGR